MNFAVSNRTESASMWYGNEKQFAHLFDSSVSNRKEAKSLPWLGDEHSARLYHELYHLSLGMKLQAVLLLFCLIVLPSIVVFLYCYFKELCNKRQKMQRTGALDEDSEFCATVTKESYRSHQGRWETNEACFGMTTTATRSDPASSNRSVANEGPMEQKYNSSSKTKQSCGSSVKITMPV